MNEDSEKQEWNTGCLKFIGIFLVIVIIVWVFISEFNQKESDRVDCENSNGEYVVIQQKENAYLSDVYGCVK